MSMKNPCFDKKTRTDCPDRCAGCGATCEKWKEYEQNRNQMYARKKEESDRIGGEIKQKQRLKKLK